MPRFIRQLLDGRRLLPPTLGLLLIMSVLPMGWVGWTGWFGVVVRTVVAPVMNPASAVAKMVRPRTGGALDASVDAEVREDRDLALFHLSQAEQEIERLRRQIKDLQGGVEVAPDLTLRRVAASVIGRDADSRRLVLHIRVGSMQGVAAGAVAVVDGAQLLGRVQAPVGPKVSSVQLITDLAAGRIRGLVMVDGAPAPGGVECDLEPVKGGLLQGRLATVEARPGQEPVRVEVGQLVRLHDATWPKNAQMLELGRVEKIEPNPEQPLRQVITVRPRLDLVRASEVVVRTALEADAGEGR
jgi:cell shape-determining protein MreC